MLNRDFAKWICVEGSMGTPRLDQERDGRGRLMVCAWRGLIISSVESGVPDARARRFSLLHYRAAFVSQSLGLVRGLSDFCFKKLSRVSIEKQTITRNPK